MERTHTAQTFTSPAAEARVGPASAHLRRSVSRNVDACLLEWALFALLALWWWPAGAHETDQYTVPVGREFANLGPQLSLIVHSAIVEAVNETNTAIKQSLQDARPTDRTSHLQAPDFVAGKVWWRLFAAFPTNETVDGALASERTRARYPGLITDYRPEQSIYDDPLLFLDITKMVRSLFRACTVSVDGKSFGTDKIIHFIHLGHIYYSAYLSAKKRGLDESAAVSRAVQVSTRDHLILSENWLFGKFTTGIRSNGDLAANYAGFKFYRNLTEEVRIGNRVMAPMLVRQGLYWRLNDQTQPDSDFFTTFVTPHWNEALNPNSYAIVTGPRMRTVLRSRCPDLLDWYRDEHGRHLSRRQFAEIQDELSTFYGEEYGYRDDGKDTVSIATTCFQSQPSAVERESSPDAGERDFHTQSVFGLQSEWGRHGRSQLSSPRPSPAPTVDEFGRTQLWWAAKNGRLEEVERLLAEGDNPNAGDIDGEGPLHAAARWGRAAIAEILLAHGADPDMQALYGMTPLQVAVLAAQIGMTRTLLTHNANANVHDLSGTSPLHEAASRGNHEMAALLLDFGADPGAVDDSGATPLHLAARRGDETLVKILLSHGANWSVRNKIGVTAHGEGKQQEAPASVRPLTHAGGLR